MIFETMRSLEQNLTFNSASATFKSYGVDFSKEKYLTLGMIHKSDGLFTNLALLISDQCQHTIKVAVFGDDENTTFKDNREFKGSIFKQLYEYSIDTNASSKPYFSRFFKILFF